MLRQIGKKLIAEPRSNRFIINSQILKKGSCPKWFVNQLNLHNEICFSCSYNSKIIFRPFFNIFMGLARTQNRCSVIDQQKQLIFKGNERVGHLKTYK